MGNCDQCVVGMNYMFQVVQVDGVVVFYLDVVGCGGLVGCIVDVEGMYGQLGVWFIDGLGSDDIDCFVDVDVMVMGQVVVVVYGVDVMMGFVGDWGMYYYFVDVYYFEEVDLFFVDQGVGWYDDFVVVWFEYVVCDYMVEYVFVEWFDYVVVFDVW